MMQSFGKGYYKTFLSGIEREWVVTNGLGGFAGSTIIGANNRKHHGLLIASLRAPILRTLILSKIDEVLTINNQTYSLASSQRFSEVFENGHVYLQRFLYDELPTYQYAILDVSLEKTISMEYGKNTVAILYHIKNGQHACSLQLNPLFNFREAHSYSEISTLSFATHVEQNILHLTPTANKDVHIQFYFSEGKCLKQDPVYDENMVYQFETDTGWEGVDCHYKPYGIQIELAPFEEKTIQIVCTIENTLEKDALRIIQDNRVRIKNCITRANLPDEFASRLVQAADQFIVHRESTNMKTILAGLPWFTDWGRDTMIAMQGLTLCTKRFEDAKEILWTFAKHVKNGLVPNMFPDAGLAPLYNTVDASLWYFYSIYKYLEYNPSPEAYTFVQQEIYPVLKEIIEHYKNGTDFSIKMDSDGLIMAGSGIDQVTWMDVRVGDWVVTPRHGKPVEISALWFNALKIMAQLATRFNDNNNQYSDLAELVSTSFNQRFWNEELQCLYDVVDEKDAKIRPNQIFAIFLPFSLLPPDREKRIVETVHHHLYTTYGLRSLSPFDPDYQGKYFGELIQRDAAYHQGTVWAFPIGAFVSAYCKVHNHSTESIEVSRKIIKNFEDHLNDGCIGGIAEIFDGDEPNISRGCYSQAWSVGEVLRAYVEDVLWGKGSSS